MPDSKIPLPSLPTAFVSFVEESPRKRTPELSDSAQLKEIRRLEFELGRSMGQQALRQAGWRDDGELNTNSGIGKSKDRSPIWPPGFVGSISHSDRWVWVAVARAEDYFSIGIDTEMIVDPSRADELRDSIGSRSEWDCLAKPGFSPNVAFTLLFSAKEAFFKLSYPLTKTFWDFREFEVVSVHPEGFSNNPAAGTVFLRSCKPDSGLSQPEQQASLILNSHLDFTRAAHPVRFQIIDQDVFAFAMIARTVT